VSQENTDLKAAIAKSLADAESAKAEQAKQIKALRDELKSKCKEISTEQVNDNRICNLILRRKELKDAVISDDVIDEQLPLPEKDGSKQPVKKRRLVACKKEEQI
jgi:hypothetical protein